MPNKFCRGQNEVKQRSIHNLEYNQQLVSLLDVQSYNRTIVQSYNRTIVQSVSVRNKRCSSIRVSIISILCAAINYQQTRSPIMSARHPLFHNMRAETRVKLTAGLPVITEHYPRFLLTFIGCFKSTDTTCSQFTQTQHDLT